MKKVLSILLALIIALSAFSMAAFAADAPKTKTEALLDKLYTATELQVSFTPDKKFASDLPRAMILPLTRSWASCPSEPSRPATPATPTAPCSPLPISQSTQRSSTASSATRTYGNMCIRPLTPPDFCLPM